MRILYHWTLDPASRQARIALGETKLKFKLEPIDPWAPSEEFAQRVLEGRPPALQDHTLDSQNMIIGPRAICEYAAEISTKLSLIPGTQITRAECRRLCAWFETRFNDEVIGYILGERLEKMITRQGTPDTEILREGRENLDFHLNYVSWLLEDRNWLTGADFSLADIAAGAHISCLDYFSEIAWKKYPRLKEWYQMFKSRPSVRPVLEDRLPGLLPPSYYMDPDF